MDGYTTWVARDLFFVVMLAFNAGGLVYLVRNHLKHSADNQKEILRRLNKLEDDVSQIKGELKRMHWPPLGTP